MGRWIRPRPRPEEIDEWDHEGKHYYLSQLPMILRVPLSALIILIAIPLAAIAAIYAEIGYALHRLGPSFRESLLVGRHSGVIPEHWPRPRM